MTPHSDAQVSPAIILITRGAPEGGMLQSWLFTSRSQNLVSGKLRSSGFWSYSNFFKWNRVKMAKNGQKMVEIFLGGSYMISNNIFSIFCFSTFSLGYFTNPAFWINFKKIALKTGSQKYPREKVEKQKMLKMLLFIISEAPKKFQPFFGHFWPFLPYFTWKKCCNSKNPNSPIYPKPDSDSYW